MRATLLRIRIAHRSSGRRARAIFSSRATTRHYARDPDRLCAQGHCRQRSRSCARSSAQRWLPTLEGHWDVMADERGTPIVDTARVARTPESNPGSPAPDSGAGSSARDIASDVLVPRTRRRRITAGHRRKSESGAAYSHPGRLTEQAVEHSRSQAVDAVTAEQLSRQGEASRLAAVPMRSHGPATRVSGRPRTPPGNRVRGACTGRTTGTGRVEKNEG